MPRPARSSRRRVIRSSRVRPNGATCNTSGGGERGECDRARQRRTPGLACFPEGVAPEHRGSHVHGAALLGGEDGKQVQVGRDAATDGSVRVESVGLDPDSQLSVRIVGVSDSSLTCCELPQPGGSCDASIGTDTAVAFGLTAACCLTEALAEQLGSGRAGELSPAGPAPCEPREACLCADTAVPTRGGFVHCCACSTQACCWGEASETFHHSGQPASTSIESTDASRTPSAQPPLFRFRLWRQRTVSRVSLLALRTPTLPRIFR